MDDLILINEDNKNIIKHKGKNHIFEEQYTQIETSCLSGISNNINCKTSIKSGPIKKTYSYSFPDKHIDDKIYDSLYDLGMDSPEIIPKINNLNKTHKNTKKKTKKNFKHMKTKTPKKQKKNN